MSRDKDVKNFITSHLPEAIIVLGLIIIAQFLATLFIKKDFYSPLIGFSTFLLVIVTATYAFFAKRSVDEMKNSTKVAEKHLAMMTQPIVGFSVRCGDRPRSPGQPDECDFYLVNEGNGPAVNITFKRAVNKTLDKNILEYVERDVVFGKSENQLNLLGSKSKTRFLTCIPATGESEKGLMYHEYEFETEYSDIPQARHFISKLSGQPRQMRLEEYIVKPGNPKVGQD